jgi:hypothetical protein
LQLALGVPPVDASAKTSVAKCNMSFSDTRQSMLTCFDTVAYPKSADCLAGSDRHRALAMARHIYAREAGAEDYDASRHAVTANSS